jgi:hypothetical protein
MAQVDSENSTAMPVVSTRRHFLSQAAGLAAGGSVLAMGQIPPTSAAAAPAGSPDPVYGLIEAHRAAAAAHSVALKEQAHLEDGDTEAECHADMDAFHVLIETAPTTLAGLVAWVAYLDEVRTVEAWMFEEQGPAMVVTLVEALGNLAVTS